MRKPIVSFSSCRRSRILCSAIGVMVIIASLPSLWRTLGGTHQATRVAGNLSSTEYEAQSALFTRRPRGDMKETLGVGSGGDRGITRAGRKADARRIGQSTWLVRL